MPGPSNVIEVLAQANKTFFDYWEHLATAERPPRKSAINPAEITKIIPKLVIYEREDPSFFRIRLMGTSAVQRIGVDLTGRNLLNYFHYAAKEEAQHDLNRIVDEPCGQFVVVRDRFTSGREALVQILRLPLTDETGETRYIIGCTEETQTTDYTGLRRDEPELIAERIKGFFLDLAGNVYSDTIWTNGQNKGPHAGW